jgi:hypothetical protein
MLFRFVEGFSWCCRCLFAGSGLLKLRNLDWHLFELLGASVVVGFYKERLSAAVL